MIAASFGTSVMHRRLEEVALVADALAAGAQLGALALHGVGDEPLHRVDAAAVGERAHARGGVEAVADFHALVAATNLSTNRS